MKYLPELLSDLWALGCYPDLITRLLRLLIDDATHFHAADLGCGKGAAAITLADEFGIQVIGIDVSESFLADARERAKKFNVDQLCRFMKEDINTFIRKHYTFDLVIYSSLGPLLGDLGEIMKHVRRLVRPDGYILIDEAYCTRDTFLTQAGYSYIKSHNESVKLLLKWGDILIADHPINPEQTAAMNRNYINSMRKQADKLIRDKPEIKQEIDNYIRSQAKECEFIESHLTECIWILQKRDK